MSTRYQVSAAWGVSRTRDSLMLQKVLNNLPELDRAVLMYAFENDISQFVYLRNNKFIGVNVQPIKGMLILETKGSFTYGEFKQCF